MEAECPDPVDLTPAAVVATAGPPPGGDAIDAPSGSTSRRRRRRRQRRTCCDSMALDYVDAKLHEFAASLEAVERSEDLVDDEEEAQEEEEERDDEEEERDEETSTCVALVAFESGSSSLHSLPTCSDGVAGTEAVAARTAAVGVEGEDTSSTDTLRSVEAAVVAGPATRRTATTTTPCNHNFYMGSEVYVINVDDDDDDVEGEEDEAEVAGQSAAATSRLPGRGRDGGALNGVIVTKGGGTIYMETPVIEEPPLPLMTASGLAETLEKKAGNPKRLSDEFPTLPDDEDEEDEVADDEEDEEDEIDEVEEEEDEEEEDNDSPASMSSKTTEESPTASVAGGGSTTLEPSGELQTDGGMSFRLGKMNINPSAANCADDGGVTTASVAAVAPPPPPPTQADIASMDLIERRDFETEQRLTGGVLLKSSSLTHRHMLNLTLIKSSTETVAMTVAGLGGSSAGGRTVASDSKCAYKDLDLVTTPTSSRSNGSVRLTKSTAKMNLCVALSHAPAPIPAHTAPNSASVIVEVPTTSASAAAAIAASLEAAFASSNSNDSLSGSGGDGGCAAATDATAVVTAPSADATPESGCSRTSPIHQMAAAVAAAAASSSETTGHGAAPYDDDALPSTSTSSSSSARCQYAPPSKAQRQVQNASAQTNVRFLMRSAALPDDGGSSGGGGGGLASSSSSSGASLGSRPPRRRTDSLVQLSRSSISGEIISSFTAAAVGGGGDRVVVEFSDDDPWAECEANASDLEEVCTCHQSGGSGSGNCATPLNESDEMDGIGCGGVGGAAGGDLSNYIQMVSITEEAAPTTPTTSITTTSTTTAATTEKLQRKRKYNESRFLDASDGGALGATAGSGGGMGGTPLGSAVSDSGGNASRKRIAYDFASTPCTAMALVNRNVTSASPQSVGRRTPRSLIPTRENPPPELQNWLEQFQRWSHAERILAVDRLIESCEPTQVRHMMKVIEPQFQRDFISLLPRELALQVLSYLAPKDLLRAAQTCRSWRFLCDDNLLWKEKCRKAQILSETTTTATATAVPTANNSNNNATTTTTTAATTTTIPPRTCVGERPKRGRAGNMPPITSLWKAAFMRQHIIEMNWRSRPIRQPKVLKGHDDHVITCLQFSGNRIVSGSDDNTLKVWSAVTGRCLKTLVGHTGGVWSSQMSGNIIISGSTDRTLKVWDMETGQCVHTLLGHTSTVRCMHLHGNKVVSGSRDATLRVWDIELGTCLHVLVGHLAAVRCVQYDGKLIVSGAYDYMVKIWHPERQECLHTLQGHTNRVYSLQFDGIHVVSGSLDTSIRVWDAESGNCKHTLMGHQSLTSGMELRQNILVSGNADSTVKVWDITTGQCLQTLSGPNKHQSAVTCLQFNSRFVVTSSDDGTVKLWDVKTGEFIRNLVALDSGGSGGVVWRIRANDTKLICAVGSRNGTEETKLMVLDFDVEGACVKCS